MSETIYTAGLLGTLYAKFGDAPGDTTALPELVNYLKSKGIELNKKSLGDQLIQRLEVLEREFDYYDASELKVNEVLERYIVELLAGADNGQYERGRDISMMIVSLGNKGGEFSHTAAVQEVIDRARKTIDFYKDLEHVNGCSTEVFSGMSRQLTYLEKILSLLDIFISSRLGMLAGLEEYAPMDYNQLYPIADTDFAIEGMECNQQDECACGCKFDEPLKLLQGMEDFLTGKETDDSYYFTGVARANNIRLENLTGNEGPVFDAIKDIGNKAYDSVMAAWKVVSEWFTSNESEKDKETENQADTNKKSIQSMPTEGVEINDKAKAGITALAEKTDDSGAMSKIVAKLTTPSSAGGVVDSLLGLLSKKSLSGEELQSKKKEAETALADLKKSAAAATGSDDNKEAASATRTAVEEKIKAAKEAVKNAKQVIQDHNKITQGIRKAIAGITPKIFIKEGASDNKE